MWQLVYKKLQFQARKTTLRRELGGGLITFFTMVYILPVNANILSADGAGIPYGGVLVATALVAALGSMAVGISSNLPIGVAPGMGANVFLATTMMNQFNLGWHLALAVVIISSLIVALLATLGIVERFISSLPIAIRHSLVVGLGVYLAYVGLKSAGIISTTSGLALGSLTRAPVLLALAGIFLVFALTIMKFKMAIIYALVTIALVGLVIGQIIPDHKTAGLKAFSDIRFNYSQFSAFGQVFGQGIKAVPLALTKVPIYPAILALIFLMLSGSSSTIIAIGETTNLKTATGTVAGSQRATCSIALTSVASGILGSSTTTGFLESNAGAKFGARTGIAAVFTGLLFLLSIPLFPLLELLFEKSFVTAPALVCIGSLMVKNVTRINWKDPVVTASSFLMLVMMWFTASILNGLAFGLVAYVVFELVRGNYKTINIYTYLFGMLFLIYIITIPFLQT